MTQETVPLPNGVKEQYISWVGGVTFFNILLASLFLLVGGVTECLHKIDPLMANDHCSCQCYQHLNSEKVMRMIVT